MNWEQSIDNLFNANHRNLMIEHHHGTMAECVKVEELEKEFAYQNRIKRIVNGEELIF